MKCAREMFEDLGYRLEKQEKDFEHLISYCKSNQFGEESKIIFNKNGNVAKELDGLTWCIYFEEIYAIQQQIKELGWEE